METISNIGSYFIPIFLLCLLLFGILKKIPVFSIFLSGAKKGLLTTFEILPTLIALLTAIQMLKASGFIDIFSQVISPVTSFLNIPADIVPLAILRPISGSGSTAILSDIVSQNGGDNYISKMACILASSSETTFYTISVYYSAIGISKTGCTLPFALLADLCGFTAAITLSVIFLG